MPVDVREQRTGPSTRRREAPHANQVDWLVDNAVAYGALIQAIRDASHSVRISQLAFDADCVAYAADGTSTRLLDTLVDAHLKRGVEVRVLLNESLLLDTATPLRRALDGLGASAIRVRGISRFPQLLHAKLVIVDDRAAFLVGSPFVNGYWDDSSHRPTDARRPTRELGGRPLHDVSVRVRGRPVAQLARVFDDWWAAAGGGDSSCDPHGRPRDTARRGGARIDVVRTIPANAMELCAEGATEILDAMVHGISSARARIYIEHQYLSSRAIVRALVAALAREPELQVIALLNQNPDVTAYRGWQNARLRDSGLLHHPRVGLFTLWTRALLPDDRIALNQVFVHSKVMIVDDVWATVGSANVDGVSLHSYGDDFSSWIGQRVFRDVRNFDLNLVLTKGDSDCIASLRTQLWSEHLGADGGTLELWRERASANVSALNGRDRSTSLTPGSFVLPYSTASRPATQLEDVGVALSRDVEVRFSPSWLEVHCSPNWIRNMFA